MMRKAHQHHHNRWESSKEGLSSPWIGNFQRTSLCRPYEKEGRKEGREEMMKVLGQLGFIHSLIHPWWGKPMFIIFFISWPPSSLSMLLFFFFLCFVCCFFSYRKSPSPLPLFSPWVGEISSSVPAEELCHLFLLGGGCLPISASFFFSTCEINFFFLGGYFRKSTKPLFSVASSYSPSSSSNFC